MKKSNEIDIHSNISIICFLIKNNNYLFSFKGGILCKFLGPCLFNFF